MSQQNESSPEDASVFVRVHTRIEKDQAVKGARKRREKWARFALVFDTETTIDTKQSLNFGFYRFCEIQEDGNYVCQEEGMFYADELDKASIARLRQFQKSNRARTMDGCPKRISLGGYPLDSGSPYRLWFGFGLRGGRVNYPMMGNRIDGHSLLRQTKEDLASTL